MPKFGQFKFGLEDFGSYTTTTKVERARNLGDTFFSDRDAIQLPVQNRSIVLPSSITGEGDANKQAIISALQSVGGVLKKGINVTTQAVKDALKQVISTYELKFFIQDDNGNWIDFTDRAEMRGRNQLRKLGSISYSAERLRGQLQQKLGSLTLDNSDNFWDKPFPTLESTFDENWKPHVATASFSTSYSGKETSIYRNKAAVRASVRLQGQEVEEHLVLGVFLVDDISTDHKSRTATLSFVSMAQILTEDKLQNFKDGKTYYEHRDIIFLVKELLKRTLADSNGNVPSTFDIDNIQTIVPAEERKEGWTTSVLGPAPTYVDDGSSTVYTKDLRDIGAVESWYYDTGTVSITKGSNVITGSGTSWKAVGSSGANQNNTIRIGDCIGIAKEFYDPHSSSGTDGGSQVGGSGYYEVLAIDDSAQTITLDRTPDVTADVASVNYAVVRVYVAKQTDLYEYNPATSVYRKLTTAASTLGGSDLSYNIVRLFVNDLDTDAILYGVVATEPSSSRSSHYNRAAKIFKFKWNGNNPEVTLDSNNPIEELDLADYVWRESDQIDLRTGLSASIIGNYPTTNRAGTLSISSGKEPRAQHVPIPFKQNVQNTRPANAIAVSADAQSEDSNDQTAMGVVPYSKEWSTQANRFGFINNKSNLPVGHFGFRIGGTATVNESPYTIRHQIGNTGFCQFYRDHGSKGAILYVKKVKPTYSSNDRDENSGRTAQYWEYTYHYYDLDNFNASSGTLPENNLSWINSINHNNGNHGPLGKFIPTAVETKVDINNPANDRVYVSLFRFAINEFTKTEPGDTDTGENVNMVIYEFENFTSGSPTARQLYNLGKRYDQIDADWEALPGSGNNYLPKFAIPYATELKYVQVRNADNSITPYLYASTVNLNTYFGSFPSKSVKKAFQYNIHRLNTLSVEQPGSSPAFTSLVTDSAPLQGLTSLPFYFSEGSNYRSGNTLFYHKTSSNTFEMIETDLGGTYGSTAQDNKSFIAETSTQKPFTFRATASIPKLMEIYWIGTSSQSQIDQPTTPDLIRLGGVEQINIELAQFESLTSWQALSMMAEIGNAVYGFKPDGNFFFKRRIKAETAAYTFTTVGDSSLLSIQKGRGQSLIANHISKFPRMTKRGEIDFKVEIGADSTYGEKDFAHEIDIKQRDDASKSITLICTEEGNIRKDSTDGTGAEFKYRINEPSFSTTLSANYTTSSYVLEVTNTKDVSYGSFVKVIGRDSADNEIRKEARVGLPAIVSSNQLQVKSAVTELEDRISFKTSTVNEPNLNTLAIENAGRTLKPNDLLLLTNSTGSNYEYIRILSIDDFTLLVQRNAFGFTNAKAHAVDEKLYLISSLTELFLSTPLSTALTDTFKVSNTAEVRPVFNDLDSTAFTDDPLASTQNTHPTVALLKPINNEYLTIGGNDTAYTSHVSIKFSFDPSDDTIQDDNDETIPNPGLSFSVGDRVEITCKGISLEQDASSVHVEMDASSIQRWGKRESSRPNNPLFSRYQARRAAKRELAEFANPRWVFKVSTPITPWLSLLDVVDLQFEEMLPKSKMYTEKCYINDISFDLQGGGMAQLTLVSVDPY